MPLTARIKLPCGHETVITERHLRYDFFTCPVCRKLHKLSKEERKAIALAKGFDVRSLKFERVSD